jgi:hypothetical protein
MENTARLFNCIRCKRQTTVCRQCDHGQQYCGDICATAARQAAHAAADQRYQRTSRGKHKHAHRQRRYRQRQRDKNKKVTDQGSPDSPPHDVLPPDSQTPENDVIQVTDADAIPVTDTKSEVICHFCGARCDPFVRTVFLHQVILPSICLTSLWPLGG